MIAEFVLPISLALLWLAGVYFTLGFTDNKISYALALASSALILWKELFFLAPFEKFSSILLAYIFVASLAVALVTDFYEMLIPRFCSLWLIPFWVLFSYLEITPISFYESISGAILGYSILFFMGVSFKYFTGRDGLGEGDMEFLSMIGAFVGPCAVTTSLYIGSTATILVGLPYLFFIKKDLKARLPFAPALAIGALVSFHICLF